MKPLLVATTNQGKAKEIGDFFEDSGIKYFSLRDFAGIVPVEENGITFEDNAILKAKTYYMVCGAATIADDGGIQIDALNGEPGVKSRRWIGREMTDWELVDYTLERLKGVPKEKRTAQLKTAIAFYDGANCFWDSDFVEGYIVEDRPTEINPGYPFRSLFSIPRFGKLFKDLTPVEHKEINHRLKILERMKPKIIERLK